VTGPIALALRILLVLALYAFLGWTVWTIAQDIKWRGLQVTSRKIPAIRLVVWTGKGKFDSQSFSRPEISLGRDPRSAVRLDDKTVSAQHARLNYHHNQWWLKDLRSTNGTTLNKERVTTATVLTSGDEIRCGKVKLTVHMGSEAILAQAGKR
jgi:FHA domain